MSGACGRRGAGGARLRPAVRTSARQRKRVALEGSPYCGSHPSRLQRNFTQWCCVVVSFCVTRMMYSPTCQLDASRVQTFNPLETASERVDVGCVVAPPAFTFHHAISVVHADVQWCIWVDTLAFQTDLVLARVGIEQLEARLSAISLTLQPTLSCHRRCRVFRIRCRCR